MFRSHWSYVEIQTDSIWVVSERSTWHEQPFSFVWTLCHLRLSGLLICKYLRNLGRSLYVLSSVESCWCVLGFYSSSHCRMVDATFFHFRNTSSDYILIIILGDSEVLTSDMVQSLTVDDIGWKSPKPFSVIASSSFTPGNRVDECSS